MLLVTYNNKYYKTTDDVNRLFACSGSFTAKEKKM